MSDGQGGLSGTFEFIGEQAQNATKGAGNAVKAVVTTAANQVKGTGGVASNKPNLSGSFDLKSAQASQGGDLFAPDKKAPTPAQQMLGNSQPLTQQGQKALTGERVYTQDELTNIQRIEQELRTMHQKNNNLTQEMEKARREREEVYQQRLKDAQDEKEEKKMDDIQEQQKQQDVTTFQAQRGTEIKGKVG